ncbi:MAG TPA: disulfide bond formation protein B [Coxiellaceae bacterium]|nr:disulfide bond formation protein B [Coxiellaceae bacterium]
MRGNLLIVNGERFLNIIEILCIALMLLLAFALQFIMHELPCPLCLLQRFGFLLASFGLLMNLRFGFHPSHYALTILSALFTAFVALRQVALHVVPGTGSYGSAVFGLHLYTWCFVIALVVVIGTTIMLGIDRQYGSTDKTICKPWIMNTVFAIIAILIASNIFSVLMECGLAVCPDNPLHYAW